MRYSHLKHKVKSVLLGTQVVEQTQYYGYEIVRDADSKIYIDNVEVPLKTLEEAREYIDQKEFEDHLEKEIREEIYEEVLENKIIKIISETHNTKVTDKLLETYISLASSKVFIADEAVYKIRSLNKYDCVLENRIDFMLDDGSTVLLHKETVKHLNNLLSGHSDIVEHMRQSKENFVKAITQILGE